MLPGMPRHPSSKWFGILFAPVDALTDSSYSRQCMGSIDKFCCWLPTGHWESKWMSVLRRQVVMAPGIPQAMKKKRCRRTPQWVCSQCECCSSSDKGSQSHASDSSCSARYRIQHAMLGDAARGHYIRKGIAALWSGWGWG